MKEERGGGVRVGEEGELLDATTEELNNWQDSCEGEEGVVPGAMLQEAVKEGEEEERVVFTN